LFDKLFGVLADVFEVIENSTDHRGLPVRGQLTDHLLEGLVRQPIQSANETVDVKLLSLEFAMEDMFL
jgi:hypothetical protein